jgi:hypothetical protein
VDSQNVTISDSHFKVADDAICLKNNHPDQILRNISVCNCVIRTLCNAVKLGTNSSGIFENIRFSNLIIHNPAGDTRRAEAAICLSSVDGGLFRQISFEGIQAQGVRCGFYLVGGNRKLNQLSSHSAVPGRMEDVTIANSSFLGTERPSMIVAHPEAPFQRIDLCGVRIENASLDLQAPCFRYDPEAYPSSSMYGSLPASVLYASNARDLGVHHSRFTGPSSAEIQHFRADSP